MNKAQIVPIISAIALFAQSVFHQQITPEIQDAIANFISSGFLLGSVVWGIIKKFESKNQPPAQ